MWFDDNAKMELQSFCIAILVRKRKLKVSRNTQGLKLKLKKHTGSCCFDRIDGQRYKDFAAFADILSNHKKKIHRAVHYYRSERIDDRDRSTVLT